MGACQLTPLSKICLRQDEVVTSMDWKTSQVAIVTSLSHHRLHELLPRSSPVHLVFLLKLPNSNKTALLKFVHIFVYS